MLYIVYTYMLRLFHKHKLLERRRRGRTTIIGDSDGETKDDLSTEVSDTYVCMRRGARGKGREAGQAGGFNSAPLSCQILPACWVTSICWGDVFEPEISY